MTLLCSDGNVSIAIQGGRNRSLCMADQLAYSLKSGQWDFYCKLGFMPPPRHFQTLTLTEYDLVSLYLFIYLLFIRFYPSLFLSFSSHS
jgi:hypothetical protein